MAAKIKVNDYILTVNQGFWSCDEFPDFAETIQIVCDTHFKHSNDYLVDIDEQSVKLIERMMNGQILQINAPASAPKGAIF